MTVPHGRYLVDLSARLSACSGIPYTWLTPGKDTSTPTELGPDRRVGEWHWERGSGIGTGGVALGEGEWHRDRGSGIGRGRGGVALGQGEWHRERGSGIGTGGVALGQGEWQGTGGVA